MRKILSVTGAVCFALGFLSSAHSAEVLMATWYGKFASEHAFEKRLKELHPDVKISNIDAKGKKSTLANALRKTDLSKIDVIYSFGTTGTKITKQYVKDKKPIVFNLVSAPVLSKIANSMEEPGNNLTGAKFLVDLDLQFKVLAKLRDYKTLGVWFDPREKQSALVLSNIKKIAAARGATVKQFRIIADAPNVDELIATASAESNKLDAIYLIGNTSFGRILGKMHAKLDPKLMVVATASIAVEKGSTFALGMDYVERGRTAAEMVSRILKGEQAGKIPVSPVNEKNAVLYINKDKMASVGLKNLDKLGLTVKYLSEK